MLDHNELDKLLSKHGWVYDNGWPHDSVTWDCFTDDNYGSAEGCLVVLSKHGKGRILKVKGMTKEEIWAGPLESEPDVAALMEFIKGNKTH